MTSIIILVRVNKFPGRYLGMLEDSTAAYRDEDRIVIYELEKTCNCQSGSQSQRNLHQLHLRHRKLNHIQLTINSQVTTKDHLEKN